MNQHIADSWGDMPNATVVNYGVPLDLLTTDDIDRKMICLYMTQFAWQANSRNSPENGIKSRSG